MKPRILTDKSIQKLELPPGKTSDTVRVDSGLFIKITKTKAGGTARSFVFRYTLPTGQRKIEGLGSVKELTLERAKLLAADRRRILAKTGQPPADYVRGLVEERQRVQERDAYTFAKLLDDYLASISTRSPGYIHGQTLLCSHLCPLRDRPVASLTRADGVAILQSIMDQGYLEAARAVGGVLARAGRLAVNLGKIELSPFDKVYKIVPWRAPVPAPSVDPDYPDEDIVENMRDIFGPRVTPDNERFFLLLLFTLMRSAEVSALKIEDWKDGRLTAWHTKTRDRWDMSVNPVFASVLDYCAEGRTSGPFCLLRCPHGAARKHSFKVGRPMRLHGWRSAGVAWIIAHGGDPLIADAILQHAIGSTVTRRYIRTDFIEQRAKTILPWHEFLRDTLMQLPVGARVWGTPKKTRTRRK